MQRWMAAAIVAALWCATSAPAFSATPPTLSSARIERRGKTLELHFQFSGRSPRLNVSAHGSELWIDLGRARLEIPPRPLFGYESAPITSVRAIDVGGGHSRIVVEVAGKADYAIAGVENEIILRVAAAGADPKIAAPILVHRDSPAPSRRRSSPQIAATAAVAPEYRYDGAAIERPPSPELRVEPATATTAGETPERAMGRPLVMIDPGHGGYDPGTQSAAGDLEKDLALQIAARLKAALEARGMRAAMTRSSDEFISLPERARIANRANADLFVSIHLNSSPNAATTGIEVYYLNNTTDRATIRLARIENGEAAAYGASDNSNLNYILTDLRQNYKASEAASLARTIDAQVVADLDAGLGLNVNALGAKMGPFYVLVGAHMPAVLVECGFMSNPAEAARLKSPQYQDLLASGIATAAVHYFNADLAVGNL